eukprot:PhF_6_TR18915/c0_g1_i2/m.27631
MGCGNSKQPQVVTCQLDPIAPAPSEEHVTPIMKPQKPSSELEDSPVDESFSKFMMEGDNSVVPAFDFTRTAAKRKSVVISDNVLQAIIFEQDEFEEENAGPTEQAPEVSVVRRRSSVKRVHEFLSVADLEAGGESSRRGPRRCSVNVTHGRRVSRRGDEELFFTFAAASHDDETRTSVSVFSNSSDDHIAEVVTVKELVRSMDGDGNKVINEYAVLGTLGQGSFGKVKLAFHTETDQPYAIKILQRSRFKSSVGMAALKQEIEIMSTFKHPNLTQLHRVINDESASKIYLVMEYMGGGVLCAIPTDTMTIDIASQYNEALDMDKIRTHFKDILDGLVYLHRHNVLHMDIKPENVLLDEEGVCKLADFGVSRILEQTSTDEDLAQSTRGTPMYFAPEMLKGSQFHAKPCDVWALGVTMFISIYGYRPFRGGNIIVMAESIQKDEPNFPMISGTELLVDLVRRMLCKEPSMRLTAKQAASHPFFKPTVPLEWSVRLWKEYLYEGCSSVDQLERLMSKIPMKDNTDKTGRRTVTLQAIESPFSPVQAKKKSLGRSVLELESDEEDEETEEKEEEKK